MKAENHSSKHYLQCCLTATCEVQYSPLQQKNNKCQKNSTSNHILPQWIDKTKVAPWLPRSFCRQGIKEIWRQDGLRNHNIDTNFHDKQQIISKAEDSNFLGWCHVVWYIGMNVSEQLAATIYREVQVWRHIPEDWNLHCTSVRISYLV